MMAHLRWLALAWLAGMAVAAAEAPRPPLTSVREIRGLSVKEAKEGRPVKLDAVVIFARLDVAALFVHDGGGGIFIEQPPDYSKTGPKLGDRVQVTGVTGEGLFAPVIRRDPARGDRLAVLGPGVLPPPRALGGEQLSQPAIDCERISVEARVLEVTMNGDGVAMECEAGPCHFSVVLQGPVSPDSVPWDLAESRVVIVGVAATAFNANRQMTRRLVRVDSLDDIRPLDPKPSANPPPALARADSLFQLAGPGPDDLIRMAGTTTLAVAGRGLYIRTPEGGLWVQTAQPIEAPPGTRVEIEGWPRAGELKPFLRARRVTLAGTEAPPQPRRLEVAQALHASHDSDFISVQAELLDMLSNADGTTLVLRGGGLVFQAVLGRDHPPPEFGIGSVVRVAGIALVSSADVFAPMQVEGKLLLLLPSARAVELVSRPPWWTPARVAAAAGCGFAAGLAFFGIARSRRLREQATKHREFEAVLAERGRFAREIHDSLAQGLTSISLQLECVRDEIRGDAPKLRSHIETARRLVRDSLGEARRTVWNLRPLALGEADLASALQRHAADLNRDGRISCRQEIEGNPRPLPPEHEAALLRIGQEALANAVRHADPGELLLRLRYGADWVTLTVRDNGRGFDLANLSGAGFGLTSMRERVAPLGGSLSIDSIPGEGTEVSATLPT